MVSSFVRFVLSPTPSRIDRALHFAASRDGLYEVGEEYLLLNKEEG